LVVGFLVVEFRLNSESEVTLDLAEEGMGIVILEPIMRALPVICLRIGLHYQLFGSKGVLLRGKEPLPLFKWHII
jgi:hypothetical protein